MGDYQKRLLSFTNYVNERYLSVYYQTETGEYARFRIVLYVSFFKARIAVFVQL